MNLMNELDDSYPQAIYRLLVDGVDIGTKFQDRLNSLTITDNRGMESDALEVVLSDHDGLLNLPPKDAVIQAWIGWSNTGLVYKGLYKVKEVEHSGAPDILTIRASSADLKSGLKQKKERSFSNVTLEAVLQAIAFQHELDLSVHQSLAKHQIINLIQNESDANLLTRLADEHDAMASIKNGKLLFIRRDNGDQDHQGRHARISCGDNKILHIKLYEY